VTWAAPDLRGRVAVVTGASRGVGRGVALALGDGSATVYVTGRSTRAHARANAPATVEDTADDVSARGGRGIPAVADHTDDAQT
jgi:NAD(P)-dependent dehydrogenase (short-subunit alcohol dehydrogenase family)